MEDTKKSFVLYLDLKDLFEKLSDEDAGQLIKAVFHYASTGDIVDLPPAADMLLGVICQQMDRDREKWEEIRAKRVKAIYTRYHKAEEATSEYSSIHMNTHETVNVNGNVNVNDNVNVNGNVINNSAPPPNTTHHGHFGTVILTPEELEDLKATRPRDWEAKLQRLDDYQHDHPGKVYKDPLRVILRWAKEDDQRAPADQGSVHFNLERRQTDDDDFFENLFPEDKS